MDAAPPPPDAAVAPTSLSGRVVAAFLTGHLTPLLLLLALTAGAAALRLTPREEEPQIVVPLADVLVQVPGAGAAEVERTVATRLEKLLMQIDGVEYVYSMSRPDAAIVTVRFYVGEDREASLVKIYNKLSMNLDAVPPQVAGWVVKPIEIDDVPILTATLYSDRLDDYALRRIAEECEHRLQAVPDTGRTTVVGGRPRRLQVRLDPDGLDASGVSADQVAAALRGAATATAAGTLAHSDASIVLDVGRAPVAVRDLEALVVAVNGDRPVYLRDVATVVDGPAERTTYTRFGFGLAGAGDPTQDHAAVTLAVAKKKGTNAVVVAQRLRERLEALRADLLPDGVGLQITRDTGATANGKVNELIEGLVVAVVIVTLLIALVLGWREGAIVATAVPIAFALTLLVNYLLGYTINRVTLFALILALGLVVDDPIVDVENIYRHLRQRTRPALQAVLDAVNEVRPPIIMATLAVIVSFLPMFFITDMMGPYMRPMALNVPLAMCMSLLVAFTVTPWMSYHVLKNVPHGPETAVPLEQTLTHRWYAAIMTPLLGARRWRWTLLGVMGLLFLGSGWLAATRRVPLKMLPYDNKGELQVVVDLPEGTTLERTEAAAAALAACVRGLPEVTDVTSTVGTSSPIDFNGLVRHHYLRTGPNVADLRVNLVDKFARVHQSHQVALRLRAAIAPIAEAYQAVCQVVEPPPGPPVIATVAVEVVGAPALDYRTLCDAAETTAARLRAEPGVVDVDTTVEAPHRAVRYVLDRERAALHGVTAASAGAWLQAAVGGRRVTPLHVPTEVNPLEIEIRLPRRFRSRIGDLERLTMVTPGGPVALGEIGRFVEGPADQTIYHKNLRRVAYVFAEVAGRTPAAIVLDVSADRDAPGPAAPRPVAGRTFLAPGGGRPWHVPDGVDLRWSGEGEWKVTLDAFRDLGIAFGVACLGIYILLVHETRSYVMPWILMISIPLTVIGILPGFWLLNLWSDAPVAGVPTPTFFTATGMIGMIALSGIAVRNAILLIEFVHRAQAEGRTLRAALIASGAVRFRPIFLTAGTAMLAAVPITLDPIFSGLAWALIFGLFVSTAFTLVVVPVTYFMVYGRSDA